MEDEPRLTININGGTQDLEWDNTTLFTFRKKEFDHIFIEDTEEDDDTDEERGRRFGTYLFRLIGPVFDDIANYLVENDYTHIHQPHVPDCDMEAWEAANLKDVRGTDFIPDDFYS